MGINVEAYILSYNEEKMVRHTLNHYTSFCSKVFLYDNQSTDNTRTLAAQYPQVEIRKFESNTIDERHYLQIKNHAWKGSKADYVIVCDIDEFIYSPALMQDLEKLKANKITIPAINGYNMYCDEFPNDYSRPIFDQVKRGVRAFNFDKQIIFNPQRIKEINYLPGCHYNEVKGSLLTDTGHPLKLLHYKYLSIHYLNEKHRQYALRLSNYNLKREYGKQYIMQNLENDFKLLNDKAISVI